MATPITELEDMALDLFRQLDKGGQFLLLARLADEINKGEFVQWVGREINQNDEKE